jgi:hypothetical protein
MADRDCEPFEMGSDYGSALLGLANISVRSLTQVDCSIVQVTLCLFRTADRLFYWERLMAFAYFLMTAGGLLTLAGWIAIALSRNALHSTAQI